MMLRYLAPALGCALLLSQVQVGAGAPVPKGAAAGPLVVVRAALDRADITLGQPVNYDESVPVARGGKKVDFFGHRVVRIGRYDRKAGAMVNLRPADYTDPSRALYAGKDPIPQWMGFLPGLTTLPNGVQIDVEPELSVLGLGRRGEVTEFTPERLGIFLIWSEWEVNGDPVPWRSQPVVLIVRPPLDADGKPVVKDEWLKDD